MYDFFMHWSPQIPGTDGEVGLSERGFIAVETSPGGIVQNDDSSGTGAAATTGCVRQSSKRWQVICHIHHSRWTNKQKPLMIRAYSWRYNAIMRSRWRGSTNHLIWDLIGTVHAADTAHTHPSDRSPSVNFCTTIKCFQFSTSVRFLRKQTCVMSCHVMFVIHRSVHSYVNALMTSEFPKACR